MFICVATDFNISYPVVAIHDDINDGNIFPSD